MSGKVAAVVVAISCAYICFGGVVFKLIEEPHDKERRHELRTTLDAFFNNSESLSSQDLREILPTIQDAFYYGVDVFGNETKSSNWDFYSAVFFAVTVVTTIGYGNIPLKTEIGRQFCIFYGVAGVPLCLFTLFVVGQQEKRLIYYIAKKLAFGFREDKRKLYWFSTIMVSLGGSAFFIYLSAVVFMVVEGWAYTDAIYFCAISLLTIGFGDYVAGGSNLADEMVWYRLLIALWILFGLSWCTIVISVCQDIYMDLFERTRKAAEAVGTKIEGSVKSKIEIIASEMQEVKRTVESDISEHNSTQRPFLSKVKTTGEHTSKDEFRKSEVQSRMPKNNSTSPTAEQCPVSTD